MKKDEKVLADRDMAFVKDLSRRLVVRAYMANSQKRPRNMLDKIKKLFHKQKYEAPVIDILDALRK